MAFKISKETKNAIVVIKQQLRFFYPMTSYRSQGEMVVLPGSH